MSYVTKYVSLSIRMITIVTGSQEKQKELAVEAVLREAGVNYRLITLNDKAYTVDDVIRLAKEAVKPEEVCKTIVLRGKQTNAKAAIFLRGNDKGDFSAAKKYFGEEMAIATPEQVEEVAGVAPGAVCPFLLTVPLFLDQQVLSL